MIPKAHILEWASKTPWPEEQQVEQDLLICRALVAIFSDDFLSSRLAFRGGTALNKIFFSGPYRYSEDIDLVQHRLGAERCPPLENGHPVDEQVKVQLPTGLRDDRASLGNVQERCDLLIDLSRHLPNTFRFNIRRQSMTHFLSNTLMEISDIRDSCAFRSAAFSTPLHLFRIANVVSLLDIENSEG